MVGAALCVAGAALGDIDLRFAWQAWHLVTSTITLRGRRGTCGTGLALVTRLVPVCRRGRRGTLRGLVTSTMTLSGRRGTSGTGLALVTRLVPVCRRVRRGRLRGRRGAW